MKRELVAAGAVGLVVVAATAALSRGFVEPSWRGPVLSAIALSLLLAVVSRRLRLGPTAAALSSLVGLGVFVYLVHLPPGPAIPGLTQWRQAVELFAEGLRQLQVEPAPAPVLVGLLLLTTGGAWIVTHVAHELVVRARRPGLALVPVLVLWAAPLTAPQPIGRTWPQTLPLLAAAGLLLLLESDADVAGWARDGLDRRLSAAGVVVGVAALALAAVGPGLLPGYAEAPWWDLTGARDPRGYQPIVDVGDRLTLPEPRDVLDVTADRKHYLRLAGLDTFDRTSWRIGPPGTEAYQLDPRDVHRVDGRLPLETPLDLFEEVEVDITVLDLENIWLPVPYQPIEVTQGADDLIYSTVGGFIASTDTTENELAGRPTFGITEGKHYRVRAAIPTPTADDLRAVDPRGPAIAPYTQLPEPYPRLAEQAREVYEQAGADTAFDRALALQRWFTDTGGFTYSTTDVDRLLGDSALETFVFETRVGYCEYFASAMAVMLRATDIPARVAVGFAPGRLSLTADPAVGRFENVYTVSTSDAHAWVEVLFPGQGWIRFDPTPRSDGNVIPATDDVVAGSITLADQAAEEAGVTPEEGQLDPRQFLDDELPRSLLAEGASAAEGGGGGVGAAGRGVAAGIAAVGLVALVVARWRRRPHGRRSGRDRVLAAQRRVHAAAAGLGIGRRRSETTTELTERWIAEGRAEPSAAERFARLGQDAAFAGLAVDDEAGERAEALADDLIASLRASATRRDRLVAPVRVPLRTTSRVVRTSGRRIRRLARSERDR